MTETHYCENLICNANSTEIQADTNEVKAPSECVLPHIREIQEAHKKASSEMHCVSLVIETETNTSI